MKNNQLSESVNVVSTFCLLFIIAIEMLVVLLWLDKQNFIPAVMIFTLGFIILILANKKPQLFDRLDKIFKKWGFLSFKKSSIIFIIPFAISFEILSSAIANNSLTLLILIIFMIIYCFCISYTFVSMLYVFIVIVIFLVNVPTLIMPLIHLLLLIYLLLLISRFNLPIKIIIYVLFLLTYLIMIAQLIFKFPQFIILPILPSSNNYDTINNSSLLKLLVPMLYGTYIWLISFILADEKLSIFVNEIISRFSAIVLLFIAFLSNDILIEIFTEKTQLPDKQVIKIISMAIQYFTIPSLFTLIFFKIRDYWKEAL